MGSGISLTKDQVIIILKREIYNEYLEIHNSRQIFTDDGYEIYYDYSDEVELNEKLKLIDIFRRKELRLEINK